MHMTAAVVVTYNRKELLRECLGALLGQTESDLDVLVVDNASTDGTDLMMEEFSSAGRVLYLNTGSNLGGAGGFQYGMREAVERGYKYVWVMDDDCIPNPNALRELLIAAYGLVDDFGFLSSKVLWKDGSLCSMNIQRHPLTKTIRDFSDELVPATLASFVSLFVRSDVIREVGLPIKEFFIWTDDWEFTRRISLNYDCFVATRSVVVHKSKTNIGASIVSEEISRLDRFDYLYRNDVVLYRREGLRGLIYEAERLTGHTLKVLAGAKNHRAERVAKIWGGTARGLSFHPRVEYPTSTTHQHVPIRVLELTGEPISYGGQEAFIVDIISHMDLLGLHIDVLTPFYCDNDSYRQAVHGLGGKLFELGSTFEPGTLKLGAMQLMATFFATHRYDIVHIHSGSTTFLAETAALVKRSGVDVVIVHSHVSAENMSLKRRAIRRASAALLDKYADVYCACSEAAASAKFVQEVQDKAHIIRNGIDISKFVPNEYVRMCMREEIGLDSSTFVVGHVGRFTYQKNQECLLKVFSEVCRRRQNSALLLVGDGPNREQIEAMAKSMGVQDNVLFAGNVTNVHDYLQAMDVFLFPSRFEGLGIVCIEAQAAGLPVVVSDRVPHEANVGGRVSVLSLDAEAKMWANTVLDYYGDEKDDNAEAIRRAGYDISSSASELRDLYFRLAGR